MKNTPLSLSLLLASLLTLQSSAWAQDLPRTDGIGDQAISQAQRQIEIIRHELTSLDRALLETEVNLKERKATGQPIDLLTSGTLAAGIGLAELTMIVPSSKVAGGAIALGVAAVPTAVLTAVRLIKEYSKRGGDVYPADTAVTLARQEIAAARVERNLDEKSAALLTDLEGSLNELQVSLKSYIGREKINQKTHLAGLASQAAGTAVTLYMTYAIAKGHVLSPALSLAAPALLATGDLVQLINTVTPAKIDEILTEIQKTRQTLMKVSTSL